MAEEDVDWGMDDDFDPWQPTEEQAVVSNPASIRVVGSADENSEYNMKRGWRSEPMRVASYRCYAKRRLAIWRIHGDGRCDGGSAKGKHPAFLDFTQAVCSATY